MAAAIAVSFYNFRSSSNSLRKVCMNGCQNFVAALAIGIILWRSNLSRIQKIDSSNQLKMLFGSNISSHMPSFLRWFIRHVQHLQQCLHWRNETASFSTPIRAYDKISPHDKLWTYKERVATAIRKYRSGRIMW